MDPNNQPQLTDTEQIMLGAQQAAMLQQIQDDEIETKVIQQQHLLNEEKIMEAQQEALVIQQMRQSQDIAEQQKEAELHRLQTFAMIEQKQEMMIQQGNQPPSQQAVLQPPGIVTVRMAAPAGTGGLSHLPLPPNLQIGPGGPPSLPPSAIPPTVVPQAHLPPQVPQPLMSQVQPPPQPVVFVPPPMSTSSELGSMTNTPPLLQQQGLPRMAGPLSQPGLHIGPPGESPTPLMSIPPQRQQIAQVAPQQRPLGPQTAGPSAGAAAEQFQTPSLQRVTEGFRNQGISNQSLQGPPEVFQGPAGSKGPPGAPPPSLGQGPSQQRMLGPPGGQGPAGGPPFPGQTTPRPQAMSGPPTVQSQPLGPASIHSQGQGAPVQREPPSHQAAKEEEKPIAKAEEQALPKTTAAGQSPAGSAPKAGQPNQPAGPREIKLPQALEKVLAFKDVRAQQMGVKPEDVERVEKGEIIEDDNVEDPDMNMYDYEQEVSTNVYQEAAAEDEEMQTADNQGKKESKNKRRKKKKKRARAKRAEKQLLPSTEDLEDDVDIEYVAEAPEIERTDPSYAEFSRIFQAFKIAEEEQVPDPAEAKKEAPKPVPIKARGLIEDDDSSDDENAAANVDDDKPKLSKKKQKKLNRLSVAELKQLVARPDVVEMHDVTARDPKLLVNIKATRNTVPVPRHWCFKRKYLQGKRGIEKPPFDLPDFIKATGIMEMRQALQEKEDQKTMKSKMRERVRPKMGKIDIDYQKLHDAFFKWQTKPKLSTHGDLYYEGKEFETRLKEKKPGNLTDDLRTALGMPIGPNANNYPPPWLIAMQRYGPPPSYPNLKIPGLNAPIPEACAFGYHAGGWGKPPVDESGKPLYGDVFGTQTTEVETPVQDEDIDRSHWGELESDSEEESEEEEDSDEELEDSSGLVTPGDAGLITPSGVTSVPIGVETPDMIELRKKRIEDAMDQGGDTPALYQVLPEKKAAVGGAMMGSAHVYDISAVTTSKKAPDKAGTEGVEVALNPDELDLDTAAMQAKYDQTMREQQSQLEKEDLSDMVAEHAAKQQKKRKKQQQEGKTAKKYKEFKF